ncbi:MAG: tRNA adenosine(34) deaminase TadA [Vicinamibacteria bacterium]
MPDEAVPGPPPAAPPEGSPDERFMRQALDEARQALHLGEVPIGAVLVQDGEVIASGFNQPLRAVDPTAHAEIVALRRAARALGNYRLGGTTLYVTLEPCLMCAGALLHARVERVVYGASEPKFGGARSKLDVSALGFNHQYRLTAGVLEAECRGLVQEFFRFRRENVWLDPGEPVAGEPSVPPADAFPGRAGRGKPRRRPGATKDRSPS